jgi:hypothetical protein
MSYIKFVIKLSQVVDRDSALLNLANERAVGVADSNHRTMCIFESAVSQRYDPVWKAVLKMAQEMTALSSLYVKTTEI